MTSYNCSQLPDPEPVAATVAAAVAAAVTVVELPVAEGATTPVAVLLGVTVGVILV